MEILSAGKGDQACSLRFIRSLHLGQNLPLYPPYIQEDRSEIDPATTVPCVDSPTERVADEVAQCGLGGQEGGGGVYQRCRIVACVWVGSWVKHKLDRGAWTADNLHGLFRPGSNNHMPKRVHECRPGHSENLRFASRDSWIYIAAFRGQKQSQSPALANEYRSHAWST
jgi:hypothetical protein